MSLLLGLPGIEPNAHDVGSWCTRRVALPEGWRAIEVERLWVRGKPRRLTAHHGDYAHLEEL
jgi:protein-glucosylgalactosylhydroxylysine glucosidase